MVVDKGRVESVLLAGAAGDAIGGPFEGHEPDAGRVPGPPPWRLSDDTRLTFATCRAIEEARAVDPERVARAFVAELRAGLPGVGSSTLKALRDLAAGQHWALAGARGEYAAGNGAAMRIAPLAFFVDGSSKVVRDVASITHRNDEAIAAAHAVVSAMQMRGVVSRGAVFEHLVGALPDTALTDALAALAELPATASAYDASAIVGNTGRASSSVALALFIACAARSVEDAIVTAIRCGGDTDTVASIAAQIRAAWGDDVEPAWHLHLPLHEAKRYARAFATA